MGFLILASFASHPLTAPLADPGNHPVGFAGWIGTALLAVGGILRALGYGPGGTKPYSQLATDLGKLIRGLWKGDTVIENVTVTTFENVFALMLKILMEQEGMSESAAKALLDPFIAPVQASRAAKFRDWMDREAGDEPLKSAPAPDLQEAGKLEPPPKL